jgi:hypothetical protein
MEYHFIFLSWDHIWLDLAFLTWKIISSSSPDIESDFIFLSWHRIWCYLSPLGSNLILSSSPEIKYDWILLSWHEISFHLPLLTSNLILCSFPDIECDVIFFSWHRISFYLPLLTSNLSRWRFHSNWNSASKRSRVGESTLIDLICFSWVPRDFFLMMRSHHHNVRKTDFENKRSFRRVIFNKLDMILATKLNIWVRSAFERRPIKGILQ